ncbi:penicillin-binding protein activator [Pleionea sediminis]|uniref:penicillin-binding protein activator n=1 Tax=Pleionea sediminis TaxID=2569479 RepID=UPI0013DD9241|nr:penicillin-binding protein activator [Pleionea sediminis]
MHKRILTLLVLFLIASCSQKNDVQNVKEGIDNANYYLGLAKDSPQPQKSQYLLKAATILAQKAQYLKAQETFSFLNPEYLSSLEKESYYLYYGMSLNELEQTDAALKFFKRIQKPSQHDIDWQITYRKALSKAYLKDGNYYEAAKIRIEMEDLLFNEEQIEENHQFIWDSLSNISEQFLRLYQTQFSDPIVNGWLDIALLTRKHIDHPEQLLSALNQWKQRYPLHPANVKMPYELKQVAEAKVYKPKQIALLLPLSGKIASGGRMIRDGFFAAHYNSEQARDVVVKVYDTAKDLSPLTPYERAIKEGADFIVGPLTKEAVQKIAELESLEVPQLSLNHVDGLEVTHKNFYQFGLPLEDEAQQIADLAKKQQHQKAVILAPSSDQGDRTVNAFREAFEKQEGNVAEIQYYSDPKEIKMIVKRLLNIDNSERRKDQLVSILGQPLEYVQRRRQDVDMVFLVSSPGEARRIKPFLDYYFAHDLPVYSVSRINSGAINAQLNNDLNGIVFTDSPMLISNAKEIQDLKSSIAQVLPSVSSPFGRLFALGFDAYQIIPNLNMMQAFTSYKRRGLSGYLSVDQQGRVNRTLSIAQFKKGVPSEIIPPTDEQEQKQKSR